MTTRATMALVQLIHELIHWIWCLLWHSDIVIYFDRQLTSVQGYCTVQTQDHSLLVLEFLTAAPQCREVESIMIAYYSAVSEETRFFLKYGIRFSISPYCLLELEGDRDNELNCASMDSLCIQISLSNTRHIK